MALAGLSLLADPPDGPIIASDDLSCPDGNLNGGHRLGWCLDFGNGYGIPTVAGGQAVINSSGTDAHRVLSSFQGPGTVA